MRTLFTNISVWVATVTLAISVGGNLFQMIVIDPAWSASPPESVRSFATGTWFVSGMKRFHTSPIVLPGLLCLLASPLLAWNLPRMRAWLLAAVAIQAGIMLVTLLYFYPMNRVLGFVPGGPTADPRTIVAMTHRWILADRFRLAFRFAAFLCLLRAMVLSGARALGR
jgi:anthrone oxygenase-like protein